MKFEVRDELAGKFRKAIEVSGENEEKVIERMFKTYIYDIVSKQQESFLGLEVFMKRPQK